MACPCVHSSRKGDVILSVRVLSQRELQPWGNPAACSAPRRDCFGVILVFPTFLNRGKCVPIALPNAESVVGCCRGSKPQEDLIHGSMVGVLPV